MCRWVLLSLWLLVWPVSARAGESWSAPGAANHTYPAISPTPTGQGHLGQLDSGKVVDLRFHLPASPPESFRVALGNVVAYSGRGNSYQLTLRVDSPSGPVVFRGPVVTDGNRWNSINRSPIELASAITPAHLRQGYVDFFVTAAVKGDGWTVYRHCPGRPIRATSSVLTEKSKQLLEVADRLAARGLALIPMPREISLTGSDFDCGPEVRIVISPAATEEEQWAAEELARELSKAGTGAAVAKTASPDFSRDIVLGLAGREGAFAARFAGADPVLQPEGYSVRADSDGTVALAADARGLYYATLTLRQLVVQRNGRVALAGASIRDWPAFPLRGFQYDIARGQTVDVDFCKRVIQQSARMKMNAIMFYMEDDFRFKSYPFLGRKGTFTKEKALELSEYARPYGVQLIPQFESLGHAGAVLRHEPLKALREAGQSWVFCSSEPKTWGFLDHVYGELAAAFPDSKYLHVGGDEFEPGFAKCPRCRARAEKDGPGALYCDHMNRLNTLVKKRGRRMLFWPAHSGPAPELTQMSLQYAAQMPEDAIPTEWVYHGPATYPTIEKFQQDGYKDVWCSPAVVGYSSLYPNYRTTFRGIRGFFRAGQERKCSGAMTTTWEFMHGALFENAWLGLAYTAECAWSLGNTPPADFDRRFASYWLGVKSSADAATLGSLLSSPLPAQGKAGIWQNQRFIRDLFWYGPRETRRKALMKASLTAEQAAALIQVSDKALDTFARLRPRIRSNTMTLDFVAAAVRMIRLAARKFSVLESAAVLYSQGERTKSAREAAAKTRQAAEVIRSLLPEFDPVLAQFSFAIEHCGAYAGDRDRLARLKDATTSLAADLDASADRLSAGKMKHLRPGYEFGLGWEKFSKIGEWSPREVKTEGVELSWRMAPPPDGSTDLSVEFEYTRGSHGLAIRAVALFSDDRELSKDEHPGWAGSGTHGNRYRLRIPAGTEKDELEIRARVASSGGTESFGKVWLILERPSGAPSP